MKPEYQYFNLCILIILLAFTGYAQAIENDERPHEKKPPAKVLVVCYSRTGSTGAMAKEIAKRFEADLIFLDAKAYGDNFMGQIRASRHAWNEERMAEIEPETVEMSRYGLVFLGSPIWWYRPAVPLWTFVEKNNFEGKAIVLFNTFNSKFKPKHIREFAKLAGAKGGNFLDHVYVMRGRVYNQIDRDELLEQVNELLDVKEERWRRVIQLEK